MTEIPYTVRRSTRAPADPASPSTRPVGYRWCCRDGRRSARAAAAVRELGPWISRRVVELRRAQATVAARGDTLPFLGQTLQVRSRAWTQPRLASRR